ncbi:hypothetical protein GLOTRDRAFT_126562 [Gloeophyllum trabeum ATCC 11539]|uniref:Ricin B lectin domain-containing protein n=1 Tax=Gloeophyllum trabeum (strain ATCC 11539 / FP-39264 / Madison 617) TaxID=670483 RepID=S7QFZ2_GLOTA|nr:uncharacterized protein GLOTRDRAFT_126562 [Gloeophyllum trabeum ATCC 11539]EPQ58078.1 hypothetical protein GLOTRDRAFT_126562 [Gloeophyllum trabeum ATCC 11539]
MKFSTVAASAVFVFASLASAAPHMKRAQVCDLSALPGLTITTSGDSSGQIRWDLFQNSGGGIQAGTLAWFGEKQPDGPAQFRAIASTNGPNIFSFQRSTDSLQVVASGSGFQGASSGGTEFLVTCTGQCNQAAGDRSLAASGCTMQVTDGNGNGTGQCVSWPGGSVVPVEVAQCDGSSSQQVGVFASFTEPDEE